MRELVLAGMLVSLVGATTGCGSTVVIDGDETGGLDGGEGPSSGSAPEGAAGTLDGVLIVREGRWHVRIASFPVSCPSKGVHPDSCHWFDMQIDLPLEELEPGKAFTSGEVTYSSTANLVCSTSGGYSSTLLGELTIVDIDDERVVVELGEGWVEVAPSAGDEVVREHQVKICN